MDMDWLTEEWATDIGNQAMTGWWDSDGKRDMGAFVASFIARAAARKVHEWLDSPCTEHEPFHPWRADCPKCWKGIKAAVEAE